MSKTFFVYCRKSSEGDSRQSASIADQEKVLRALEEREDLVIVDRFREAHSAKEPFKRPIYRSMIERIKAGEANGILCWHLNRLVRNPLEDGELRWLLQEGTIRCIRTPEREYRPEDHALLIAVESSNAIQYVQDLKRDVQRGVREKALQGWYPYKAKAGYQVEHGSGELIIDPIRFPLLKRAWQLLLTGDYSVPQILERLNGWGYRLPKTRNGGGKPMSRSSLYRLFSDPFYCGRFTYEAVDRLGKHKPMISLEEFERAQRLLGRPEHGKQQTHVHPFTGFIRCGVCGCLITAETRVKHYKTNRTIRTYTYYHCTGRRGCPKHSVTDTYIEERILEGLETCRLDPAFADWALEVLRRDEMESDRALRLSSAEQPRALGALKKRLDAVYEMRENGEIRAEEFAERKRKYEQQIEGLHIEQERQRQNTLTARTRLRDTLEFRRDAYQRFKTKGYEAKRTLARALSGRYVLTQGKLEITPLPELERLRTIEPHKKQPAQVGNERAGPVDVIWRAMLDELRQIIASTL